MRNAPDCRTALSQICPLSDPESETLVRFDGHFWPADEPTALAAMSMLPPLALHLITADFPQATRAARLHIADGAELLAQTAGELLEPDREAEDAAADDLHAACSSLAAQVSNALAYREILDAVCGPGHESWLREATLASGLSAFETGQVPTPGDDGEGTAPSPLPCIDYLCASPELRDRAGGYLMAFALLPGCDDPFTPLATAHDDADEVLEFACAQVHQPHRYAHAVRERRTLDPYVLAPRIESRELAAAQLPWGA